MPCYALFLCTQEIAAVTSSEAGKAGSWQYDFTDPEGPQMGTVAVPGSAIVTEMADPCIIVAQSDSLGITLPQNDVSIQCYLDCCMHSFIV
jgi:hypothetical protein